MTLLPQRKKSAEEIAQLRDSLGIPGSPESSTVPSSTLEAENSSAPPQEPTPTFGKVIQSGTSSSGNSTLPSFESGPRQTPQPAAKAKPVRSLKKSEREPRTSPLPMEPASNGLSELQSSNTIPSRRRSNEELQDIRKRQTLAMMDAPAPNPKLAKAHALILIPGYLCASAGAGCFIIDKFPLAATAGCSATALLIALFIFLRRPMSRHHAGFIAVITLFVSTFSALHFFPQLQYAS